MKHLHTSVQNNASCYLAANVLRSTTRQTMQTSFKKGNTVGFPKGHKPHNAGRSQKEEKSDYAQQTLIIRPSKEEHDLAFNLPLYGLKPQEQDQAKKVIVLRPMKEDVKQDAAQESKDMYERYCIRMYI